MALPTLLNFSVSAGDNSILEFDIETGPVQLNQAVIRFDAYAQENGVPETDTILFSKELDYGIEAESDGEVTSFAIELEQEDTANRLGNFYYEVKMVDGDSKNFTLAAGILTVTGLSASISSRSLKLRFPELAEYADDLLEFAIALSESMVDDSWIAADIPVARMFLAAHLVSRAQADADRGDRSISSESIGRISISYATSTSSDQVSSLKLTSYGEHYLRLMRGSHSGPVVV